MKFDAHVNLSEHITYNHYPLVHYLHPPFRFMTISLSFLGMASESNSCVILQSRHHAVNFNRHRTVINSVKWLLDWVAAKGISSSIFCLPYNL
jgi:hypothetical protein